MKIGLKSGYEFFCDDGYYPDTNKLDGEVTYTFISLGHWLSRKNNVTTRNTPTPPSPDMNERTNAYVSALLRYPHTTYSIRNLNLYSSRWSIVTAALHRDGLIEAVREQSPTRWRILATKEELAAWAQKQGDK